MSNVPSCRSEDQVLRGAGALNSSYNSLQVGEPREGVVSWRFCVAFKQEGLAPPLLLLRLGVLPADFCLAPDNSTGQLVPWAACGRVPGALPLCPRADGAGVPASLRAPASRRTLLGGRVTS
jgi:hypothetical protein